MLKAIDSGQLEQLPVGRVRAKGGDRKRKADEEGLLDSLRKIVESSTIGDLESARPSPWQSLSLWRGKPLYSHQVIVNLISATTTKTGLKVVCRLDDNEYPKGRRISDKELAEVNLHPDEFHGEWNYTIRPSDPKSQ